MSVDVVRSERKKYEYICKHEYLLLPAVMCYLQYPWKQVQLLVMTERGLERGSVELGIELKVKNYNA